MRGARCHRRSAYGLGCPGSGLLSRLAKRFRVGHSAEVWTSGTHVLARVGFFGKLIFTGSLSPNWAGDPFSIAYVFDPQDPTAIAHRSRAVGGKPLAIWHRGADTEAIATFESHIAGVNDVKAEIAGATPVERAPMPVVDETMKARVRTIYAEIVAKKGLPKKTRQGKVSQR
jgi:hypothetical protein